MRTDYYVYALLRADGVTPFYIGKGQGRRVQDHASRSSLKKHSLKNSIIRKVIAEIGSLPHEIVAKNLTETAAFELEAGLITMLGRRDTVPEGYLANHTDGGEGASGRVRPQSEKDRITAFQHEFWSDHRERDRMSTTSAARWRDHEQRQVMTSAIKRGLNKPGVQEKKAYTLREIWSDPTKKAGQSAAAKARWTDPEFRRRHAESMTSVNADPSHRDKLAGSARQAWSDDDKRARTIAAQKAYHATPEAKAKKSDQMRKIWAARRAAREAECA